MHSNTCVRKEKNPAFGCAAQRSAGASMRSQSCGLGEPTHKPENGPAGFLHCLRVSNMNNQWLCWAKTCGHRSFSQICGPFIPLSLHLLLITGSLFLIVSSSPVSSFCFNLLIILYLPSTSFHFLSCSPSLRGRECRARLSWQQRWEGKMVAL